MENKKLSQRTGKRRISAFTVINTIVLILVAFTMLYPFWYVLMGSFMSSSESVTSVFHFFVKKPTLEAYRSFFSSHNVGRHFLASAYASVFGMVVSLLCTSMAAYALSRKSLPGKNFVMKLVLGAMLFSGGMIPIYMVVRQLKMINTWESLYIPGIINL
jgi:putative aldouronate transport system permease protein